MSQRRKGRTSQSNGKKYEYCVAKYLKRHGFSHIEITRGSNDYGVDIIARKWRHWYAIQCKHYASAVGIAAVQQAVAGRAVYDCDKAMVVTSSTFTHSAVNLAEANDVTLLAGIRMPVRRRPRYAVAAALAIAVLGILLATIFYSTTQPEALSLGDALLWAIQKVVPTTSIH